MRKLLYVGAAAAALAMSSGSGNAMSINIGAGLKPALDATDMMQKAAVFIIEGYRYCFYFNGWHGPGWYRCGFAWRRNLGWGGEYGWQSWSYGPAERRYGRGGATVRGTIEGPSKNVEGGTTIRRSPPVTGPKAGGGEINMAARCRKTLRLPAVARCRRTPRPPAVDKAATKAAVKVAAKAAARVAAKAAVVRSDNARSIRYHRQEEAADAASLFCSQMVCLSG